MRTTRTTLRSRLVAFAAGLGIAISAAAVPSAAAAPDAASGGASHGASRAAAVHAAVGRANVSGIAWYTDAATGRVMVTADSTVTSRELDAIRDAAGHGADALSIRRAPGVFRPLVSAGDAIYGGGYRCSLGFNVVKGSTYYFLTAGHCAKSVKSWYTDAAHQRLIGPTVDASFPRDDYALVRYDNTALSHPGGFTAADAYVGQRVTRDGSTTGVHSGTVTALDVTVKYRGAGSVSGMIQTDVCAEPGDSGGPLYDGSKAIGITSGGSGDCTTGGITFFQSVTEALTDYGVSVY